MCTDRKCIYDNVKMQVIFKKVFSSDKAPFVLLFEL